MYVPSRVLSTDSAGRPDDEVVFLFDASIGPTLMRKRKGDGQP